jgi:O-antigen/teichoic acid export membrane protein
MSRLLVRLLAAALVCEGVVLSLLAAAFIILERVEIVGPVHDPAPLWVRAVQGAVIALWVVVVWAGAHALWTGRYRAERVRRRLLYALVGGHFVVSFGLPVWFGGPTFNRRDARAALVLWLLGLACWAALHFASPRPEKPSSRGRRHQPKPGN